MSDYRPRPSEGIHGSQTSLIPHVASSSPYLNWPSLHHSLFSGCVKLELATVRKTTPKCCIRHVSWGESSIGMRFDSPSTPLPKRCLEEFEMCGAEGDPHRSFHLRGEFTLLPCHPRLAVLHLNRDRLSILELQPGHKEDWVDYQRCWTWQPLGLCIPGPPKQYPKIMIQNLHDGPKGKIFT